MKKLIIILFLFPLSGFAQVDDISCEQARNEIQNITSYYVGSDVFGTLKIDYGNSFKNPYDNNFAIGDSTYCLYEWRMSYPEVTVTGKASYPEGNQILYMKENGEWRLYGTRKFTIYQWIVKQEEMKEKVKIEEDSKRLKEEEIQKNIVTNKNADDIEELKKAEEEAKRIITEKLAQANIGVVHTGSTNIGTINILPTPKPLTLKEKQTIRLNTLKEIRLKRLKEKKEIRLAKFKVTR